MLRARVICSGVQLSSPLRAFTTLRDVTLCLMVTAMLAGPVTYADTLNTAPGFNQSSGAFSPFALGTQGSCSGGTCIDGTPFWNNTSGDNVNGSHAANPGDFLGDAGAFALNGNVTLNCSTCGVNYMAGGGQMYTQAVNSPLFANAFSFVRQAGSLAITLLYAASSTNNNAEFGIYDASSQANALNNHVVVQAVGTNLNNIIGQSYNITNPYATWGVYARACSANAPTNACPGANVQTLFSNVGMNGVNGDTPAADVSHMHWALFQSGVNANVYFMALDDNVFTGTQTRNPIEGWGDYNDIILQIDTTGVPVPEPATLWIVGCVLVLLGIFGKRFCRLRKLPSLSSNPAQNGCRGRVSEPCEGAAAPIAL